MEVNELAELICGSGYRVDWPAISAVATAAAVFVALGIPAYDRRMRKRSQLETEARNAAIVSQSLSSLIELMPDIIAWIKETDGVLLDTPANELMYATDECQALIEKEAFVHQLPMAYLGTGQLTVDLARYWCREIEIRFQTQRNQSTQESIDWKNCTFVCSLGQRFHNAATQLHEHCQKIQAEYRLSRTPILQRLFKRL